MTTYTTLPPGQLPEPGATTDGGVGHVTTTCVESPFIRLIRFPGRPSMVTFCVLMLPVTRPARAVASYHSPIQSACSPGAANAARVTPLWLASFHTPPAKRISLTPW